MTDRVPGAPGQHKAIVTAEALQQMQAGEEFTITLRRDDQPVLEGTPYSKAAVLPDAVAEKLCPNIDDPAPKDAFDALAEGKSDNIQKITGSNILLPNAAHTPVKGLKLFGKTTEDGSVGDSGSVTVRVEGKNLIDYRKAIPRNSASAVTIDESINGLYWTGDYYFFIPVSIPAGTTVRFSCESECVNSNGHITAFHLKYKDGTNTTAYDMSKAVKASQEVTQLWVRKKLATNGDTVKVWNLQLEVGSVATAYEPYKEPQVLTVPTPNGLQSNDSVYDEIDFTKGVIVSRVGVTEPVETPLPTQVLEVYEKLHTYQPTTRIHNDAGADMEIVYYTPSTAVQMVHSPGDAGKVLAIDQHGCVILSNHGILESGRNGNWYYRKWADGFAECWGFFDTKVSVDLGDGLGRIDLPLPVLFEKSSMRPYVQVTLERSSDGNPANIPELFDVEFNGNTLSLYITNTNATRVIPGNVYVAGLWE